ncbi:MAG TPA: type VI secretion system accessory protein TagJ [Bryobacteraceae bacterium]|jgi:type VI secretion system protein ImpE|nr:type VI secretion system accessory protein TagJ [Bryobacteraceae bacterium]
MTAKQLFQAGQLKEAIQALGTEVRDNPTDAQRRTFLFELLCFAGEYDRAEKHLNLLAEGNKQTELGAVLYHSALHGMKTREKTFNEKDFPAGTAATERTFSGTINGQPFQTIVDADPRIGPRLELFAAGAYLWIGFEHIESIELQAPKRLRDMLWAPAIVRTGPTFKQTELGEILIPVVYPFSYRNSDGAVPLGRTTVWEEDSEYGALPSGQKMFLVDDEEFPFLEVRKIEFHTTTEDTDDTADAAVAE